MPSSQLIQRSPLVRKHPTACRAKWWIHPSCRSCTIIASIHGKPVFPCTEIFRKYERVNSTGYIVTLLKGLINPYYKHQIYWNVFLLIMHCIIEVRIYWLIAKSTASSSSGRTTLVTGIITKIKANRLIFWNVFLLILHCIIEVRIYWLTAKSTASF